MFYFSSAHSTDFSFYSFVVFVGIRVRSVVEKHLGRRQLFNLSFISRKHYNKAKNLPGHAKIWQRPWPCWQRHCWYRRKHIFAPGRKVYLTKPLNVGLVFRFVFLPYLYVVSIVVGDRMLLEMQDFDFAKI